MISLTKGATPLGYFFSRVPEVCRIFCMAVHATCGTKNQRPDSKIQRFKEVICYVTHIKEMAKQAGHSQLEEGESKFLCLCKISGRQLGTEDNDRCSARILIECYVVEYCFVSTSARPFNFPYP